MVISVLVLDRHWAFVEYNVHLAHKMEKEDIEDCKQKVVDNSQEEHLGLGKVVVQVLGFQVVDFLVADFQYKDSVLIFFLLILWNHSP
jgi:hypothetical protein